MPNTREPLTPTEDLAPAEDVAPTEDAAPTEDVEQVEAAPEHEAEWLQTSDAHSRLEPAVWMTFADHARKWGMTAKQLIAEKRPCPQDWPDDIDPEGPGAIFLIEFEGDNFESARVRLKRWMAERPLTRGARVAMFDHRRRPGRTLLLGQCRTEPARES